MPRPLPLLDDRLLRFSFLTNGIVSPCAPGGAGVVLTGEPGEGYEAGAGYFRDKLSGPLSFAGDDYALLADIDSSADRCLKIGLLLEARPHAYAKWALIWQGVFTTAECEFDHDLGTASATVTTDDAYRELLENWEQEINLLQTPGTRTAVSATLATLSAGIFLEFSRINTDEEADYLGTDGWAGFLRNTSWVSGSGVSKGTREHYTIIFRYLLRDVPMVPPVAPATAYTPVDKSDTGWTVLLESENTTTHTITYTKEPGIAGFRGYKITHVNNWFDPTNSKRTPTYGQQLLLLPCGERPSDYGYDDAAYLVVSGPATGQSLGGANNAECPSGCLNVRLQTNDVRCRSLWWRFGDFRFGRCFPLLEGLRYALLATARPVVGGVAQPVLSAVARLVPPTAALLSPGFYAAATNPATGETGAANELPRLLLSAASDVKRYGSSEAATRLLISPKTLLTEVCTAHDALWFIDPATGWLRLEHRSYAEARQGSAGPVDLTAIPNASLPRRVRTRQQQLPRLEELTIANTATVEQVAGRPEINYGYGVLDYGATACTNTRAGQNRATASLSRLTGDVAACVLSGDTIPDNALVLLAPDPTGRLADANRQLAASRLLQRYHRYGRSAYAATANGQPFTALSVKPQREQAGLSVPICDAASIGPLSAYTTNLGTDGRLAKREFNVATGVLSLTVWLPIPATDRPAKLPTGRQFDNSFDKSFL